MTLVAPHGLEELTEMVRATPRLLPVGGRTKPALSAVASEYVVLSCQSLRGVLEYEPDEFTITALAGTRLAELAAVLQERGQYLPFDPVFLRQGATLGGTVAAGLGGPGRFRFGGVRDFILGIRFIDGTGRLLRMGGKVVKNAAGFDLPKFFVGSLGRFGILTEVTLKVFPCPAAVCTVRLAADSLDATAAILAEAARGRWEIDALDVPPLSTDVYARLRGPAAALPALAQDLLKRWPGEVVPAAEADRFWESVVEASWVHPDEALIKLVLAPGQLGAAAAILRDFPGARWHLSAGGNVAWLALPERAAFAELDALCRQRGLSAMTLRGRAPLWLGSHARFEIAGRVKAALDPDHRFPPLYS